MRPPWEPAGTSPIDLVIDPGQAFGTGAHATTRLCLEMLLSLSEAGGAFVDLGCGSGVLAIAAARLGYAPVLALDNDPASVQATADNAAVNGVELEVRRFDLRSEDVPAAGTVTANLLGPLLRAWAPRLAAIAGAGAVPADRQRPAGRRGRRDRGGVRRGRAARGRSPRVGGVGSAAARARLTPSVLSFCSHRTVLQQRGQLEAAESCPHGPCPRRRPTRDPVLTLQVGAHERRWINAQPARDRSDCRWPAPRRRRPEAKASGWTCV